MKLFTASQWRLSTPKWNVHVERVVEQIIEMQEPQVMEKIIKDAVPTICCWREFQDRIQQRTSEEVANARVQPTLDPVEVKEPKIFKMTMQRKHSPGQERSQVNKQVEDSVKVKIRSSRRKCRDGIRPPRRRVSHLITRCDFPRFDILDEQYTDKEIDINPTWYRGRVQQSRPSRKTWIFIQCS